MKTFLEPPPDAQAWLEEARARRLMVQRCGGCGAAQLYPRNVCTWCGSLELALEEVSGRGSVHTFTVIHQNRAPGWADEVPYVVAMVDLAEGPRMMSNVVGCAPTDVYVGLPVEVTFVDEGEYVLPKFKPL